MTDALIAPGTSHPAEYPAPISFSELWPWVLFAASLMIVVVYFVGSFQGSGWLHEFTHDGRHLLGFPCH